LWDCRSRLLSR